MVNLATWMRRRTKNGFDYFSRSILTFMFSDARKGDVPMDEMDGLLLTGGSDITPEFLRQKNVDPTLLHQDDLDPKRDRWEFNAISEALARGLPVLAICRGIQVLNVALGGTLKLDIPGHGHPEQKDQDIQRLRHDGKANHRFENVNSSHHQRSIVSQTVSKSKRGAPMTTSSSKCACAIIRLHGGPISSRAWKDLRRALRRLLWPAQIVEALRG